MASRVYVVSLSAAAGRQLQEVFDYTTVHRAPLAAQRQANRILEALSQLEHTPLIGRPSPKGTRELVTVPPYVIRYRVMGRRVFVVRIRHGARRPTE